MLKSKKVAGVLTAGICFVVSACSSSGSPTAKGASPGTPSAHVTLRVAQQENIVQTPLEVGGEAKGTSYTLSWANLLGGPNINAAFIAGSIDVGQLGDTPTLQATASHVGVVVVAEERFKPNSLYGIVTRPGSPIRTLADLKGKKLAYTRATGPEGYMLKALNTVGLGYHDYTEVNAPTPSLPSILQSGRADAGVLANAALTTYLADNPTAKLIKTPVATYGFLLASKTAWSDAAKRAAITDFVTRVVKAGREIQQNPQPYVKSYYVDVLKQSADVAAQTFARNGAPIYQAPDAAGLASQKELGKLLADAGVIPQGIDPASEFETPTTEQITRALAKLPGS